MNSSMTLDDATKQRAAALALDVCRALDDCGCPQPTRVEWRAGDRSGEHVAWREDGCCADGWTLYADGTCVWSDEYGGYENIDVPAAEALWSMGLALDAITADAVVRADAAREPYGGCR